MDLTSTLCEMFDHTVRRWPDTVALRTVDGQESYTYSQYREAIVDVASALHGCGVGVGDVVVLMFENRPLFHIVDAAVMHLGAITCSVYNTSPVRDIEHVFRTSAARIALCESKFASALRSGGPDSRIVCDSPDVVGTEWLNDLPRSADFDFDAHWQSIEPDAPLTLIYTSGTTGTPKAVELTHRSMAAEVLLAAEALDFRAGDRVPSALPMAHAAQRWGTHYNAMAFGLEVVCIDDISKLAASLAVIQPDIWGTVPRVLEKLVAGLSSHIEAQADAAKKATLQSALDVGRRFVTEQQAALRGSGPGPDAVLTAERERVEPVLAALRAGMGLGRLRWLMVGAAPTPPHVLEFLAGLGLEIVEVWGMSELGSVATVNPIGAQKLGTVGKSLRTVEIDIAEDGEVLVRGPILMRGYRGDPERTAESFDSEGRFKTGDVGQLDLDGYLTITVR
jgi:long-subunit acyl-CoA synthetase (AMP-forming)